MHTPHIKQIKSGLQQKKNHIQDKNTDYYVQNPQYISY